MEQRQDASRVLSNDRLQQQQLSLDDCLRILVHERRLEPVPDR